MLIEQYGGRLPDTVEELTKLPGIGRKTANLIVGDIYHKPAVVCDTHCIRITNLLGLSHGTNPAAGGKAAARGAADGPRQRFLATGWSCMAARSAVANRPQCDRCCMKAFCSFANGEIEPPAKKKKAKAEA